MEIVVVTGAAGFIGRRLVNRLVSDGRRVRVLVRDPEGLGDLRYRVEVVRGDIRDRDKVSFAVRGAGVVYHLAGCARAWSHDPTEFDAVNVDGVRHVLDAARACDTRRVLHASTVLTLLPYSAAPVGRIDVEGPGWAYLRWFYGRCARAYAPTPGTVRLLRERGIARTSLWSRGIDTDAFSPEHRSDALRRQLGVSATTPVLLLVSRLVREKDLADLVADGGGGPGIPVQPGHSAAGSVLAGKRLGSRR